MFKNLTGFPAANGSLWGDPMNNALGALSSHMALNVISEVFPFDFSGGYGVDGDAQLSLLTGEYACKNDGVWVLYSARKGVMAYRITPAKLYANTGSAWVEAVATDVGGGDTIYTADGTIAENRLVSIGTKSLTFTGTLPDFEGSFRIGRFGISVSENWLGGAYNNAFYHEIGLGFRFTSELYENNGRAHLVNFHSKPYSYDPNIYAVVQSVDGNPAITPYDVAAGTQVEKEGRLVFYANSSQDGGIYTQIVNTPTGTIIDSSFSGYAGIQYANDHSANFTNNSLINLGYADATYLKIADATSTPTGSVSAFAGSVAPAGWLFCRGQAISRTTYAALFAAIGTDYGVGDGSTTFNIPDLRGEFVRGFDAGRGVDSGRVLGSSQADELKAHTHSYTETTQATDTQSGGDTYYINATSGTTGSTGGAETRPRNIAMNYMIKA